MEQTVKVTEQFERIDFKPLGLEKFMELTAKINKKIGIVQAKVDRIPKNGYNKFHDYYYSTHADIEAGIKPLLEEAKLTVTPNLVSVTEEATTAGGKPATKTTVQMVFMIVDQETGFIEYRDFVGKAIDNGDKGLYKAYTGCKKYFNIGTFNVETGSDVEEDGLQIEYPNQNQQNGRRNNRNNNGNRNDGGGNRNEQREKQEPRETKKEEPKTVSPDLIAAILKLLADSVVLGGNKESIIEKLKEKVGDFEKIETMTMFQGVKAKDQLALWYNKKLRELNEQSDQEDPAQPNEPEQVKTNDPFRGEA